MIPNSEKIPTSSSRSDYIQNDLCSGCGRWHDHTGQMLLGMVDYHGQFWELPPGHKPYTNTDDSGGRRYGFCVMGAPR